MNDWYGKQSFPMLRGTKIFGVAAIKTLWQKIKAFPGAVADFFRDAKNKTVTTIEGLWKRFKEWLRKLGIFVNDKVWGTAKIYKNFF